MAPWVDLPPGASATAGSPDGKPASLPAPPRDKVRRAYVTQALLMYHAAVRLAQPRPEVGTIPGALKGVPTGTRWTPKSCHHPLRVRQLMLRAVRALHGAAILNIHILYMFHVVL